MSRLDKIKARAEAATDGPWSAKGGFTSDPMIEVYGQTVFINPDLDGDPIQPEVWADVEFISAAREDVPWLLTLVESLTAERDALAAKVARVESLAEEWRYKGQFGWGPWQVGEGPDPEGYVMDHCASALRAALAGSEADTSDTQPIDQGDQS